MGPERRRGMPLAGIAVSAGELDEEQARELAETREKLKNTLSSLQASRGENRLLRLRLSRYEPTDGEEGQCGVEGE